MGQINVMVDLTRFTQVRKERRTAFLTKWNAEHAKDITGKVWPKFYLLRTDSAERLLDMILELESMVSGCFLCGWTISKIKPDDSDTFAIRNRADYIIEPRRLQSDPYYD